ncbi:hypothetical protein Tco_0299666 [Tanacetum coccineum]
MMQTERRDGVAGFKRRRHDLSSAGVMDLTTASRRTSTPPSDLPGPFRNAECSNCKLLLGKIKLCHFYAQVTKAENRCGDPQSPLGTGIEMQNDSRWGWGRDGDENLGGEESTPRCQTFPSMRALGKDQPVIPKVTFIQIQAYVQKQCDEDDAARQEAITCVIKLFDQAREEKEDLRKQYAECKDDISPERRALIEFF